MKKNANTKSNFILTVIFISLTVVSFGQDLNFEVSFLDEKGKAIYTVDMPGEDTIRYEKLIKAKRIQIIQTTLNDSENANVVIARCDIFANGVSGKASIQNDGIIDAKSKEDILSKSKGRQLTLIFTLRRDKSKRGLTLHCI